MMEGLWDCIEGDDSDEKDETEKARKADLEKKAYGKLVLLVDQLNYSHIQTAKTAKEIWQKRLRITV